MRYISLVLAAALVASVQPGLIENVDFTGFGPTVKATKGEVWPKPQFQEKTDDFYIITPQSFKFKVTNTDCQLLQNAITRYWKIIAKSNSLGRRGFWTEKAAKEMALKKPYWFRDNFKGKMKSLNVSLVGTCDDTEHPSFGMDEAYILNITTETQTLTSKTIWGVLRGLETFSQLIHMDQDYFYIRINLTNIQDFPRFPHRGLLLDTARHFIPLHLILTTLDAMSYSKFNVFHWHLTDDQSFPYKSVRFPEMSNKGAYHPVTKVYEAADVQKVIEYARQRGIRVIPEFDTPGHTQSWGQSIKDLLTPCYNGSTENGKFGPIDPTKNETFTFLQEFFDEVVRVFPDKFIHLGGDEVDFKCWQSNPFINKFMESLNITGNYAQLQSYYEQRFIGIVDNLNARSIVWEEVFTNGAKLPNETIVHVWIEDTYKEMLSNVTKAGKTALLSGCWYLDRLGNWVDWINFYSCEPYDFPGSDEQKQLVVGGETCMWAEAVNEYNVISRVWPRACAPAEKLWSSAAATTDITDAAKRLEEHTCRLNFRGIGAQPPNAGGVCL